MAARVAASALCRTFCVFTLFSAPPHWSHKPERNSSKSAHQLVKPFYGFSPNQRVDRVPVDSLDKCPLSGQQDGWTAAPQQEKHTFADVQHIPNTSLHLLTSTCYEPSVRRCTAEAAITGLLRVPDAAATDLQELWGDVCANKNLPHLQQQGQTEEETHWLSRDCNTSTHQRLMQGSC